jgi:hypothetical protein
LVITDPEVAHRVSDCMQKMFRILDATADDVRNSCSKEDYKAFKKATATIAGSIVMDVMEPLYKKHPQLAPANWNEE